MAAISDEMDRAGTLAPTSLVAVPLDRLFRLAIAIGLVFTVLVLVPGVHGHAILPAADLVLDTIAAVVFIVLTTLAWARYRERRVIAAAYHAGAFMALMVAYGLAVLISLQHATYVDGLAEPEGVSVLVFVVARIFAAMLFVVSGIATERWTYGRHPAWILVAPTLIVLVAALVGRALEPPPDALQIVALVDATTLAHITPLGALIGYATSVLFFVGAYVSRGQWQAGRVVLDGWIAIGLVFAGFAELQWTLYPSAHPGQVSTADLLRLVCSACLMAGLASALRADQRELRMTNIELATLRDAEVERAATEERTRLARELHDGLAQDLWLAKLRIGELVSREDLSVGARRAAESGLAAIDIGLGDAREAVATLRSSAHTDSGFCSLVQRTVEDYGDRFGLRVEFTFEGDHTTRIAPRTQAEILRITQEALTNVARHADASLVGVRLGINDERITLRVADNGHGFEVAAAGSQGYGLTSMRERAAIIGGQLRISSAAETGTRVVLTAPFAPSAPPVEAEPA